MRDPIVGVTFELLVVDLPDLVEFSARQASQS